MNWIPVSERVPNDRRTVLAWGMVHTIFSIKDPRDCFLGATKFNATNHGGEWDCCKSDQWSIHTVIVTHWAEIEGPNVEVSGCASQQSA